MKTIEISDTSYLRLIQLGGGLFSPSEVVDRLLKLSPEPNTRPAENSALAVRETNTGRFHRNARERGISVLVDNLRIDAVSVRDLFEKVLRWLVDGGKIKKVESALPYRTSSQRYLIANKPIHPSGNEFVVPVTYKGYSMEAHKNYENALSGLNQLARLGGFSIRVIA